MVAHSVNPVECQVQWPTYSTTTATTHHSHFDWLTEAAWQGMAWRLWVQNRRRAYVIFIHSCSELNLPPTNAQWSEKDKVWPKLVLSPLCFISAKDHKDVIFFSIVFENIDKIYKNLKIINYFWMVPDHSATLDRVELHPDDAHRWGWLWKCTPTLVYNSVVTQQGEGLF